MSRSLKDGNAVMIWDSTGEMHQFAEHQNGNIGPITAPKWLHINFDPTQEDISFPWDNDWHRIQ